MRILNRCWGLVLTLMTLGLVTLGLAAPAGAQENLDSGKTGAQIFASDCALCHKSPQALNKSGTLFGLSGFLREHYTASRETADVVAKYLESLPNAPAPAKRAAPKRSAKGDDKAKSEEKKSDVKKPDEKTSDEKKSDGIMTEEKKPDGQKVDEKKATAKPKDKKAAKPKDAKTEPTSDTKTDSKSDSKPESKSSDAKSSDAKPAAPKTSKPKTDKPKTDKKPDKQEKSD